MSHHARKVSMEEKLLADYLADRATEAMGQALKPVLRKVEKIERQLEALSGVAGGTHGLAVKLNRRFALILKLKPELEPSLLEGPK